MGIDPVEEKRKNKQVQLKQSTDKVNNEVVHATESVNVTRQWFGLLSLEGKVRETKASLQMLKSSVFGNAGKKPVSLLDKEELNEMLANIYRNRMDLFRIIWGFYLSFPILNIVVLFLMLLIVMDFFPALLTTMLYFILAVGTAVAFVLWEEKKLEE